MTKNALISPIIVYFCDNKKTNVQSTQVCHYHIRGMPKVIEGKVKYDLIFKKKTPKQMSHDNRGYGNSVENRDIYAVRF